MKHRGRLICETYQIKLSPIFSQPRLKTFVFVSGGGCQSGTAMVMPSVVTIMGRTMAAAVHDWCLDQLSER